MGWGRLALLFVWLGSLVGALMVGVGCRQQLCPSYQSLVLPFHDPDTISQPLFTPFAHGEALLPRPELRKDKNHMIKKRSYRRRSRDLRALYVYRNGLMWHLFGGRYKYAPPKIKQESALSSIASKQPDATPSLDIPQEEPEWLPKTPTDSEIQREDETDIPYLYGYNPKDSFNVDQINYNALLGSFLLPPKDTVIADEDDALLLEVEEEGPSLRELFMEDAPLQVPNDEDDALPPATIEEEDWNIEDPETAPER